MIHVLAFITAKPGLRGKILEAFHANIPAVLAEAGCIEYGPAIDAVSAIAQDTHRYLVRVSPGTYVENITMKNYVSVQASDIESTIIQGTVTYPPAYTDQIGTELQMFTVSSSNVVDTSTFRYWIFEIN